MLDLWSFVRFLHVVGAVVWLGGQLTVSALVMPVARDRLPPEARAGLMRVLGMRFGIATVAVLIPLQVATGVALARHKGSPWPPWPNPSTDVCSPENWSRSHWSCWPRGCTDGPLPQGAAPWPDPWRSRRRTAALGGHGRA